MLVTWKAIAIIVTLPLARLEIALVWILFLCQVINKREGYVMGSNGSETDHNLVFEQLDDQ